MPEQLAYSPQGLAEATQISLRLIQKEMQRGRLRYRKVGRRILIMADDVRAWLQSQGEAA
jgi:excisionase family DNA binding protein